MKKLTPVLIVEEIEPSLPFWTERLGFEKVAEVPEGERLGFVILVKGKIEIMYQTRTSVANDIGIDKGSTLQSFSGAVNPGQDRICLYIDVENLDAIMEALKGVDVILSERRTFYGAREFGVREPGGTVVTFAEFAN